MKRRGPIIRIPTADNLGFAPGSGVPLSSFPPIDKEPIEVLCQRVGLPESGSGTGATQQGRPENWPTRAGCRSSLQGRAQGCARARGVFRDNASAGAEGRPMRDIRLIDRVR